MKDPNKKIQTGFRFFGRQGPPLMILFGWGIKEHLAREDYLFSINLPCLGIIKRHTSPLRRIRIRLWLPNKNSWNEFRSLHRRIG